MIIPSEVTSKISPFSKICPDFGVDLCPKIWIPGVTSPLLKICPDFRCKFAKNCQK